MIESTLYRYSYSLYLVVSAQPDEFGKGAPPLALGRGKLDRAWGIAYEEGDGKQRLHNDTDETNRRRGRRQMEGDRMRTRRVGRRTRREKGRGGGAGGGGGGGRRRRRE